MKVPTGEYKIGAFTVGKFGSLTIGEASSKVELVIERLTERGYEISGFQKEEPVQNSRQQKRHSSRRKRRNWNQSSRTTN